MVLLNNGQDLAISGLNYFNLLILSIHYHFHQIVNLFFMLLTVNLFCAHSVDISDKIQNCTEFVGIQAVQGKNRKVKKWKAHSGIVLCLDWNAINNLLVTGGEDCNYRIWDEFGRLMYCSKGDSFPVYKKTGAWSILSSSRTKPL